MKFPNLFSSEKKPKVIKTKILTLKEKRAMINILRCPKPKENQTKEVEKMPEEKQKEKEREFENKGPILETSISLSKDGKYLIHKTIITDIKAVKYYEKVMGNKEN